MRRKRPMPEAAALVLTIMLGMAAPAAAQVLRVAELNTEQIRALDHGRTVVILPGGILEEHGPHLPSYSDGYFNERLSQGIAEAVASRSGWTALVFPQIPLGTGGANEIGRKYVFPGTYAVRSTTLRSVFMDLASELGEQGFRWVFIVHAHGAPNHNRMLDQAGDFFHDTYGGQMVHLCGLVPVFTAGADALDRPALEEDGFSVHAGAGETSQLLFLRPDLVPPSQLGAEPRSGADWPGLVRIARESSWPGYFGSPRMATAAQGARIYRAALDSAVSYALKILDGTDPRGIPRVGDGDNPENVAIDGDALTREMEILRKQEDWLARQRRR